MIRSDIAITVTTDDLDRILTLLSRSATSWRHMAERFESIGGAEPGEISGYLDAALDDDALSHTLRTQLHASQEVTQ